jgi:hypothetical protein
MYTILDALGSRPDGWAKTVFIINSDNGQSRAQAGVRSPLNQAVRHGGLPVSSWFPS